MGSLFPKGGFKQKKYSVGGCSGFGGTAKFESGYSRPLTCGKEKRPLERETQQPLVEERCRKMPPSDLRGGKEMRGKGFEKCLQLAGQEKKTLIPLQRGHIERMAGGEKFEWDKGGEFCQRRGIDIHGKISRIHSAIFRKQIQHNMTKVMAKLGEQLEGTPKGGKNINIDEG